MNIAAIYDKYDLWGKVRVSRGYLNFWQRDRLISAWLVRINDKVFYRESSVMSIKGMIKSALKSYLECEPCEGTGVVPAEPYTSSGEIPDCDVVKCKKCNGTGERA